MVCWGDDVFKMGHIITNNEDWITEHKRADDLQRYIYNIHKIKCNILDFGDAVTNQQLLCDLYAELRVHKGLLYKGYTWIPFVCMNNTCC